MGGYTNTKASSKSNWFIWNTETERHEDHGLGEMAHAHNEGADFTRLPEDALILRTCTMQT